MFCFCHQVLMTVARVEIYILYTFSESRTVFICSFWDLVLFFFFTHIFRVHYYYCFIGNYLTSYPLSSINHHIILIYTYYSTTYRTFCIVYLCIFWNCHFRFENISCRFKAQTVFLINLIYHNSIDLLQSHAFYYSYTLPAHYYHHHLHHRHHHHYHRIIITIVIILCYIVFSLLYYIIIKRYFRLKFILVLILFI